MASENPRNYNLLYPSLLPPERLLWLLEKGDYLSHSDSNTLFIVSQVLKPNISGSTPKIVLKPRESYPLD